MDDGMKKAAYLEVIYYCYSGVLVLKTTKSHHSGENGESHVLI